MPKITGVKCEECHLTRVDGLPPQVGATWCETLISPDQKKALMGQLDPALEEAGWERKYACSSAHLFSHIAKLLKIDYTSIHR
jgi:hypothetical protein